MFTKNVIDRLVEGTKFNFLVLSNDNDVQIFYVFNKYSNMFYSDYNDDTKITPDKVVLESLLSREVVYNLVPFDIKYLISLLEETIFDLLRCISFDTKEVIPCIIGVVFYENTFSMKIIISRVKTYNLNNLSNILCTDFGKYICIVGPSIYNNPNIFVNIGNYR